MFVIATCNSSLSSDFRNTPPIDNVDIDVHVLVFRCASQGIIFHMSLPNPNPYTNTCI